MIIVIISAALAIGFALTGSFGAVCEFLLLFGIGATSIAIFCKAEDRARSTAIFAWTMSIYFVYACFCRAYQVANDYPVFGSFDGFDYYVPFTKKLLIDQSFSDVIQTIYFNERNVSFRHGGSIFIYFYAIGKLALQLDLDILFALQLSLMPFAAMICVVEYHLLRRFDVPDREAYKWSLGFGLCSALFWLSSFIVRDLPIHLAYALIICLMFSPMPRWRKLSFSLLLVAAAASLRMASGIGMLPLLFFTGCYNPEDRNINISALVTFCILGFIFGITQFALETLEDVSAHYMTLELRDQGGKSTLSYFNALPFGISNMAKILYACFHPIPAWRNMTAAPGSQDIFSYTYNLTRFPDLWIIFFRITGLTVLIYGCFHRTLRSIFRENRGLLFAFIYAIIWLCAQASTLEERRKLSVYPLLFLIAVLFWRRMEQTTRNHILTFATHLFIGLQLLYLTKALFQYLW